MTLHVGLGTFAPVKTETLSAHAMHEERFELPEATARDRSMRQNTRAGASWRSAPRPFGAGDVARERHCAAGSLPGAGEHEFSFIRRANSGSWTRC